MNTKYPQVISIDKLNTIIPVVIFLASIIGFWFNLRTEIVQIRGEIALVNSKLDDIVSQHKDNASKYNELSSNLSAIDKRLLKVETLYFK